MDPSPLVSPEELSPLGPRGRAPGAGRSLCVNEQCYWLHVSDAKIN